MSTTAAEADAKTGIRATDAGSEKADGIRATDADGSANAPDGIRATDADADKTGTRAVKTVGTVAVNTGTAANTGVINTEAKPDAGAVNNNALGAVAVEAGAFFKSVMSCLVDFNVLVLLQFLLPELVELFEL